jgi:hypothetical protein
MRVPVCCGEHRPVTNTTSAADVTVTRRKLGNTPHASSTSSSTLLCSTSCDLSSASGSATDPFASTNPYQGCCAAKSAAPSTCAPYCCYPLEHSYILEQSDPRIAVAVQPIRTSASAPALPAFRYIQGQRRQRNQWIRSLAALSPAAAADAGTDGAPSNATTTTAIAIPLPSTALQSTATTMPFCRTTARVEQQQKHGHASDHQHAGTSLSVLLSRLDTVVGCDIFRVLWDDDSTATTEKGKYQSRDRRLESITVAVEVRRAFTGYKQ